MAGSAVAVDQCPDGGCARVTEAAQVHLDLSGTDPNGGVDQAVTEGADGGFIEIAGDRDAGRRPVHPDCDRRGSALRRIGLARLPFKSGTQGTENAPQQPRHVHLRHAEFLGDVVLCGVAVEVSRDDEAVAVRHAAEQVAQSEPVAQCSEVLILYHDEILAFDPAGVAGSRRVERAHVVGVPGGPSLDHLVVDQSEFGG
jgi:hypothetical protein